MHSVAAVGAVSQRQAALKSCLLQEPTSPSLRQNLLFLVFAKGFLFILGEGPSGCGASAFSVTEGKGVSFSRGR